jgi:hypothetical protein
MTTATHLQTETVISPFQAARKYSLFAGIGRRTVEISCLVVGSSQRERPSIPASKRTMGSYAIALRLPGLFVSKEVIAMAFSGILSS